MNNEERYLKEKIGSRNPFVVPEGYFEQLAQQVMQQLPDQSAVREVPLSAAVSGVTVQPVQIVKGRLVALRPWLYAAACAVVLVGLSLSLYFRPVAAEQQVAVASVESSYMDDAADYAMIDNSEIYACLTDN